MRYINLRLTYLLTISLTCSKIPDISLTAVKFPDISWFSRQVVTLFYSIKIRHLFATILMIFLRVNGPNLVHFKQ